MYHKLALQLPIVKGFPSHTEDFVLVPLQYEFITRYQNYLGNSISVKVLLQHAMVHLIYWSSTFAGKVDRDTFVELTAFDGMKL